MRSAASALGPDVVRLSMWVLRAVSRSSQFRRSQDTSPIVFLSWMFWELVSQGQVLKLEVSVGGLNTLLLREKL